MACREGELTALTRRGLLQGGIAIGGALAAGAGLDFVLTGSSSTAFVLDTRLPHAVKLGDMARQVGHEVLICDKDAGEIARHCQRRWETTPALLVGASLASTAFIIEQIAMRGGLQFVRGEPARNMAARMAGTPFSEAMTELQATSPRWKEQAVWWCASPTKNHRHVQI